MLLAYGIRSEWPGDSQSAPAWGRQSDQEISSVAECHPRLSMIFRIASIRKQRKHMEFQVQTVTLLLLIAAVVAMLTRRLRLPYSVGLVAAGIILTLSPFAPEIELTKDLIFTAILPPLLFEAAYFIHWKQLRRDFPVIATLATLGVVLSATVTATGMHYLADWRWIDALVFGALIAATDPVAVIATLESVKDFLRA
jgi:NhaP-type Na+/H+ or K+/H+ antiporter